MAEARHIRRRNMICGVSFSHTVPGNPVAEMKHTHLTVFLCIITLKSQEAKFFLIS